MALLAWLYANVFGNLVASAVTVTAAWFWKIRPHFRRQRRRLDDLHAKTDTLHTKITESETP